MPEDVVKERMAEAKLWALQRLQVLNLMAFTGTRVQILTQKVLPDGGGVGACAERGRGGAGTQCTCFTGTRVQILTQKLAAGAARPATCPPRGERSGSVVSGALVPEGRH
jgi:hypothetical protein